MLLKIKILDLTLKEMCGKMPFLLLKVRKMRTNLVFLKCCFEVI